MKLLIETTGNAFKITLLNTNFHAEEQKVSLTPKTGVSTSVTKKEERISTVLDLCRSKGSISEIFDKRKILLYQNESLDLDHYYQEPYQDENDEIKDMGKPFETDESKKIRTLDLSNEDRTYSGFSYFMDGSRRTYKIGDMVLEGKTMFRSMLLLLKQIPEEKSSLMIFDRHANLKYKYGNRKFCCRGYYVDTCGKKQRKSRNI